MRGPSRPSSRIVLPEVLNAKQAWPACSALGDLKKLRLLNMMGNKLTTLPDEVCELTNLYRLGLKGNKLETLPDNFGNLQNLVELFLTDNALKSFPDSMQRCRELVKIQVCT